MTLPNYITLFRILLVPFFFTALVSYEAGQEHYRWSALIIFIVACLSDALDGILARVLKKKSELGKFLDPLADKLLLVSGYLGILNRAAFPLCPPLWVTVTIVFRDMVIIGGLLLLYLVTGNISVKPNLLGKITTGFQMITLGTILVQWPMAEVLWYITAGLTVVSCLIYVIRDMKFFN